MFSNKKRGLITANNLQQAVILVVFGGLAFVVGSLLALLGGILPAIVFTVAGFGLVVLFNYRLGVWLLVLLLPFAATYLIPRQMFGITGLNPVNVLLATTLAGLAMAYAYQRGRIALVPLTRIFLLYLALLAFGAFMGSFKVESAILQINPQGQYEALTRTRYLLDVFFKPLIILIIAWLAAVHVRNGGGAKPLIWAIALAATILFTIIVSYLVLSGTSLQILASSRARGFLSWMGMHANELGLMANMMFAVLLFTALGMEKDSRRLFLFAAAGFAAATAALTFSRGAFLGLLVVTAFFLVTRRRFTQLGLGFVVLLVVALLLPEAIIERATTGLERRDIGAITAGRLDDIWRHLWPWVWDSPLIGHGLGSTMWAPANLSGAMLPVGHPHNAYLGLLLDLGLVGGVIVLFFFWSMWRLLRQLKRQHPEPFWRGLFEGGAVCLLLLLVQGVTDDRFVPTYPQWPMWIIFGLASGHASLINKITES
jgi:O-antigen ligase